MQFCERLAQTRKERGYTQVQLAEAIGVAKSTYAGYENGTREPDFFKLKKLISFLHVDSSWLRTRESAYSFSLYCSFHHVIAIIRVSSCLHAHT